MKKWHIGGIVHVTQTVSCMITVVKTFKIRAHTSTRVSVFKFLRKYLFIKTVQTMVIVMIYGTLGGIDGTFTYMFPNPAVTKPFKVLTTA